MSDTRWFHRPWLPVLALALLYFVLARASLLLAFENSNASPVWPPSGLAVAALLLGGRRFGWGVLAGAFAANLSSFLAQGQVGIGSALLASALIACGNLAEAWLGSWLMRLGLRSSSTISNPSDVYLFAAAAMGAALLSASGGVATLVGLGLVPLSLGGTIWFTWWLGDVTGILLLTPLLLALRAAQPKGSGSWRTLLPSLGLLLLAAWLSFSGLFAAGHLDRLVAFSLIGGVAFAALRHGLPGAAWSSFGVAFFAVPLTLAGRGPFAKATLNDSLVSLDGFLAICAVTGLVVAGSALRARSLSVRAALRTEPLPVGLLMLCLAATLAAWHWVAADTERRAAERFQAMGQEIRLRLAERIAVYEQALHGGLGLHEASEKVTDDEWARYVAAQRIKRQYPGILGLGHAVWLPDEAAQQRLQAERPDLTIRPAAPAAQRLVINALEPLDERNRRALGYDMYSDAVRREAIERAALSGEMAMSGRVHLVQDNDREGQAGVLLYLPEYQRGLALATPQQRRAALRGVVYAPVRVNDLMGALLRGNERELGELALYDGRVAQKDGLMFRSTAGADYPNRLTEQLPLHAGGQDWLLELRSTPAFEASVDTQKAQIALVAGALISLLLFSVVRALTQTREEALVLAERMSQARAEAEHRFSSLAETARDAIFVVGAEGRIESGNRAAARLCELPAEQLAGLPVHSLLELPPSLEEWLDSGHSSPVLETVCRRPGQPPLAVEVALGAWSWEGRRFFSLIARDIRLRRQAEADLRAAVQQAEQANRAKSQFLANMSHEIRTPMNAVLGLGYLLERGQLDSEQRGLVERIQLSARSLLGIINDILDLTKIEAGELNIVTEPFALGELMQDLRELMGAPAQAKGIALAVLVQPGLPEHWLGDALRLQQMLTNLLSNAIKFTERGSVRLEIRGSAGEGDRWQLRFAVHDSGIGIPSEAQSRLFEPFVQADNSTTRRFGGTGLGLSIVRRLAELMGGTVGLRSQSGVGSEFWFDLPLQRAAAQEGLAAPRKPAPAPAAGLHGLQGLELLVVDDSEINIDVARRILELEGARVSTAVNGQLALDRLRDTSRPAIDLVLMDIQMPVMDGRDATRELRADPRLAALPVIALTAGALSFERDAALAAGMNDFVTKPFEPRELVAAILRQLGARPPLTVAPVRAMPTWPRIEGIAVEKVRERLGGDLELFERLLGRLVEELRVLDQGADAEGPAVQRAARWHKLRGMAANLGATELARLAWDAESACRRSDAQSAAELPGLERELRAACAELGLAAAKWLAAQRGRSAPAAQEASGPAPAGLPQLLTLLRENNLAALDEFQSEAAGLRSWLGQALFDELQTLATALRFAELAERLEQQKQAAG